MELLTGELSEVVAMLREWLETGKGMLPALMEEVVAVKIMVLTMWAWICAGGTTVGLGLVGLGVVVGIKDGWEDDAFGPLAVGIILFLAFGIATGLVYTALLWWQTAPQAQFLTWLLNRIT